MSRYTVKVRRSSNKTFLWGGDGITRRLNSPLFLTFRVVDMGESINFGIYKSGVDGGTPEEVPLGVLKESETFTIHLDDVTGIYAQCTDSRVDTKVECFIESMNGND